jgi:molybdopterin converting factor small subunit
MALVRFFAQAREATGCAGTEAAGATVGEVLACCCDRFGPQLGRVVETSRIWVNGEPATSDHPLEETDEVAVLPPVSGG